MARPHTLIALGCVLLGACSYSWSEVPLHPNTPAEHSRTAGSSLGLDDPEIPIVTVGDTYVVRHERLRLRLEGEPPEWLTRGQRLTYSPESETWTLPDLREVSPLRIEGLFERRFDAGRTALFSVLWSLFATAVAASAGIGGFYAVCAMSGCFSSG